MFENLSQRLSGSFERLRGRGRLTEDNIRRALRDVRIALIEADVALPVVAALMERIKQQALGRRVTKSLTPGQALIGVVRDELASMMGTQASGLALNVPAPAVILLAGLQGSGKTTTAAKLAKLLGVREKKKVMLVSTDVYRPAAIRQLEVLAEQVGAIFRPSSDEEAPVQIAADALVAARRAFADVLIVDSAGRLAIDDAMMAEIKALHETLTPAETLFVVDAMTGQDAANTAKAFGEAVPLTGIVLTKTDGDARGGAALSARYITGQPIKFIGTGEKPDGLDVFHPDRIANRILDMGDVLSLVEEVERKVDQEKTAKLANKVMRGKRFDFADMRDQLEQMQKMGGVASMLDKLPGIGKVPDNVKSQINDRETIRMMAIIDSMTRKERKFPALLNGSRRARIARGSGTKPADVNRLVKQHEQMAKMMAKLSGGGAKGMLRNMKGMLGGGPSFPQR